MKPGVLVEGGRVTARLATPQALDAQARASLYALLEETFCGTSRRGFERDLDEKDWVLVLEDRASGRPVGFSTQKRLAASVDGEPMVGIFSGDTVVQRGFWGETALARAWARLAFDVAAEARPWRAYWFLICSGYKTYRFLPVFFRVFHPRRDEPMPADTRRILETFALARYPSHYDTATGIVRLSNPAPLRAGIADLSPRRLADPDVAFFARVNPGHVIGDELACLAEIALDNLTPAARRELFAE